jgi:hypothetical protein
VKKIINLHTLIQAVFADKKQIQSIARKYHCESGHVESTAWCIATERANRTNFNLHDNKILAYVWVHIRCQLRKEQPLTSTAWAKVKVSKTLNNKFVSQFEYIKFEPIDVYDKEGNEVFVTDLSPQYLEQPNFSEYEAFHAMPASRRCMLDDEDICKIIAEAAPRGGSSRRNTNKNMQHIRENIEGGDLFGYSELFEVAEV